MLSYYRISVAFFLFKNRLNDKLLVVGCTRLSKLKDNVRFCSGIHCVMLSKGIKAVEWCLR